MTNASPATSSAASGPGASESKVSNNVSVENGANHDKTTAETVALSASTSCAASTGETDTSALAVGEAAPDAVGVGTNADGIRQGMNPNAGGSTTKTKKEDADPVGDALLRILNDPRESNPFRYSGSGCLTAILLSDPVRASDDSTGADDADDVEEEFRPLLSSYNLHLVRDLARQVFSFISSLIWDDAVGHCQSNKRRARKAGDGNTRSSRPISQQTLQSTAALVVASTVALAGPTTVVVLFSLRTMVLFLVFCFSLLVDYKELVKIVREISPDWLVAIVGAFFSAIGALGIIIWRLIDDHLLLGREFSGRDGEPQPLNDDRSSDTQDHLHALSFCSSMVSQAEAIRLNERSKRLEEEKKKERSKALKKAKKKSSLLKTTASETASLASNTSFTERRINDKRFGFKKKKKQRSPTDNVQIVDGQMPDGDELLERILDDDDQEAHSDCLERIPAGESIEVISTPLRSRSRNSVPPSSYDLMFNPDLEELLSADADEQDREWSSADGSDDDDYNMLSSDASVGSDLGSETSVSYAGGSSVGSSSISTVPIPPVLANSTTSPRQSSKKERDVNWFDVGTKVGIRLLNSEKVQNLMKDPNKADLLNMSSGNGGALPLADQDLVGIESSSSPNEIEYDKTSSVAPTDVTRSSIGELLNRSLPPLSAAEPTRPKHALWSSPDAALSRNPSVASFGSVAESEADAVDVPPDPESIVNDCAIGNDTDDRPTASMLPFDTSTASDMVQVPHSSHVSPSVTLGAGTRKQELEVDQISLSSSAIFRKSLQSVRKQTNDPTNSKRSSPSLRDPLLPGVKMLVPMFPLQPQTRSSQRHYKSSHYQMATVIASERVYVGVTAVALTTSPKKDNAENVNAEIQANTGNTNCLSISCIIDGSFLRNGKFATMNLRVMDEWRGEKYMPRHSKYPIGSCVATSFGVGVLVGWRVEDDMHVVQSLWQKRGAGSAVAYLNRNALKGLAPGGVGYKVSTTSGKGQVVAYTNCDRDFLRGIFAVKLKPKDRYASQTLKLSADEILSCKSAQFMPIVEIIKSSAQFQVQIELYELAVRQRHHLENTDVHLLGDGQDAFWNVFENGVEMAMSCVMKAVSEDQEFDEGINEFLGGVITFLEELDFGTDKHKQLSSPRKGREIDLDDDANSAIFASSTEPITPIEQDVSSEVESEIVGSDVASPFFWDMFGGLFQKKGEDEASIVRTDSMISSSSTAISAVESESIAIGKRTSKMYRKIYAFLRTTMRSVAIARTYVSDQPNLQIALSLVYEFLLFIRTIIKVQQANSSIDSIQAWKTTYKNFSSIFGPMKERMGQLGSKIAKRLERHGKKAKVRLLRFIDIILADEQFLQGLELLEWAQCLDRIEHAVVKAKVVDAETCSQYHKAGILLYETLAPRAQSQGDAAQRNEEKLAYFARLLKLVASPHRSLLKILMRDDTLELIERLFVRVFQKDQEAALMLSIYASNAKSLRHLRMLKNMPVSGKLWGPLLDAMVEEFCIIVDSMPKESRTFIEPMSRLFTLGVANFHKIRKGDVRAGMSSHWLDFLASEDAVEIIQELDLKLRDSLDRFYRDVKTVMEFLPYYSTIDEDILQLIDDISIKRFLKEAADALLDADRFPIFLKDKLTFGISRFLDYLPKMSIPIERREIGEGWVLTCRDKDGQDLRLSDVQVNQENLVCEVLGGDNILSPMFELKKRKRDASAGGGLAETAPNEIFSPVHSAGEEGGAGAAAEDEEDISTNDGESESDEEERVSVLNDIADLIRNAQLHGCWEAGRGGVKDRKQCIDPALRGLPVSEVLQCGIELWQNLEMDDDELMQLAIRDVSYQIKLQEESEKSKDDATREMRDEANFMSSSFIQESPSDVSTSFGNGAEVDEKAAWRYNPRKDPTLLYIELLNMTFALNDFLFRVEPAERSTIFDPVFEGYGSLMIKNVSIKLRLECRKERIQKLDTEVFVPALQVETLEVALEKVKFRFKSTGADWLLNGLVKGFREVISDVVETKTKEAIVQQIEETIVNVNAYLADNPDLLLNVLAIDIDDLEENVVYL